MIYLLEDDDSIRELVIYTLSSQGMEAEGFSCPSAYQTGHTQDSGNHADGQKQRI